MEGSKTNRVEISDVEPEVSKEMMRFMYTERLQARTKWVMVCWPLLTSMPWSV